MMMTAKDSNVIEILDSADEFETVDLTASPVKFPGVAAIAAAEQRRKISRARSNYDYEYQPTRQTIMTARPDGRESVTKKQKRIDCTPKKQKRSKCQMTFSDKKPNQIVVNSPCSREKNGFRKRQKKKRRMNSVLRSDSDSDFEKEPARRLLPLDSHSKFSKQVPHHPPKKPTAAMLSLSNKPSMLKTHDQQNRGNGFIPSFTNLHIKYDHASASSDSGSELQDPLLFQDYVPQRAPSPVFAELYKDKKCQLDVKSVINADSDPGMLTKSNIFPGVGAHVAHGNDSNQKGVIVTASSPLKNAARIKKPLFNLSDFSSSDDDSGLFDIKRRVVATPSNKNKRITKPESRLQNVCLSGPSGENVCSLVGSPVHVQVSRKPAPFQKSAENCHKLTFCQQQRNMIEAVTDENFADDAILFIHNFTTLHRGAPEEYKMYLLKEVILAEGTEPSTVLNAYSALLHIHSMHPIHAANMKLDWDFIAGVVRRLELDSSSTAKPSTAHVLALQFILLILMEDFVVMTKCRVPQKSYAYKLLSPDMCLVNVRSVLQWICKVITNKFDGSVTAKPKKDAAEIDDRSVFKFLQQLVTVPPPSEKVDIPPENTPVNPFTYFTVLRLLQKLLLLSFAVGKSNDGLKIAEEFLYPYLHIPMLHQRTLCLQTVTCDLVRSKLIELLLENLSADTTNCNSTMVLSIHKIVEHHFRLPPGLVGKFIFNEASALDVDRTAGECEELSMLLCFLMQSYIRNKSASSKPKRSNQEGHPSPNFSQNASSSGLSEEDRCSLLQMGDHVETLEGRLRAHCRQLTLRTKLYLGQMDTMRELAY